MPGREGSTSVAEKAPTRASGQQLPFAAGAFGFVVASMSLMEPFASEDVVAHQPKLADSRIVAYFLHLRCRKL